MSNKIEILENTLLKLLVRRGGNLDRQNITLDEGELGYTTDNKRLFVGDASTSGGIVTGNKFLGTASDHSPLSAGAEDGDIAFNTTSKANFVYMSANSNYGNAGTNNAGPSTPGVAGSAGALIIFDNA